MATATRNTKTITKTVTEEVPDGITLQLTEEEARALRGVLGSLQAGSVVSQIFWAMGTMGVTNSHHLEARDGAIHVMTGLDRGF